MKTNTILARVILVASVTFAAAHASGATAPIAKETSASLPGYNIYRPSDIKKGALLPIIAWANGGCVRRDATWTTILERWASEGFFVVAVTSLPNADPGAPGRFTVEEQAAAIEWAIRENGASNSPYANRLDVNRIVAAGNSCGGMTSMALAARDARVKSVYILSGSSLGPNTTKEAASALMSKVSAPVLFIVGGEEDIARKPSNLDYSLLRDGIPAMVVSRSSGDHRTVSTDPAIQSDAADIGVNWLRATLYNDKEAIETLRTKICAKCDSKIWSAESKSLGAGKN
jgi:predicted alpha/beta-hydrolase family hydrolase